MKIRKIDIGSERKYFTLLLHEVPSLPPEVIAERMCKFMSLLQPEKTVQDASNAAAADKPDRSAPTAAIGHTVPTHMVKLKVKLKVNNWVESTVEPGQMPVFVLCERIQRQNVRLSALLD
jgi:hypothetical protein